MIATPAAAVHVLKDGADFEQAVVLPYSVVAHAILYGLGLAENAQSIFVTDAAGAIAGALTDLARARAIEVIGSVSSKAKAGYATKRGLDYVVFYKTEPLAEQVLELTGGCGVDAAFEAIGAVFIFQAPVHHRAIVFECRKSRVIIKDGHHTAGKFIRYC